MHKNKTKQKIARLVGDWSWALGCSSAGGVTGQPEEPWGGTAPRASPPLPARLPSWISGGCFRPPDTLNYFAV